MPRLHHQTALSTYVFIRHAYSIVPCAIEMSVSTIERQQGRVTTPAAIAGGHVLKPTAGTCMSPLGDFMGLVLSKEISSMSRLGFYIKVLHEKGL